jgi:hypothetical protein
VGRADDDLVGRLEYIEWHASRIAGDCGYAQFAHGSRVLERLMVRRHATAAPPADQAMDEPVLTAMLEHEPSLLKGLRRIDTRGCAESRLRSSG